MFEVFFNFIAFFLSSALLMTSMVTPAASDDCGTTVRPDQPGGWHCVAADGAEMHSTRHLTVIRGKRKRGADIAPGIINCESVGACDSLLGKDRVPTVGGSASSEATCSGGICGAVDGKRGGGRIGVDNKWHNGPEYSGHNDQDRLEAFYWINEIERRERQRFASELNYFIDQKTAYANRVAHKKDGTVSRAEIAKEESENETMLPWVLARLEGRSMDGKGILHWPFITNERGLIRGWDTEHSQLNNRIPYQFRTSKTSTAGSRVRDTYNYALYLNMVSFSYKNRDHLAASILALDLIEQADRYYVSGDDQQLDIAERFLGYAERIVDYKTGRFAQNGYDKIELNPAVRDFFDLEATPSNAFGYEFIRAANALEEYVPRNDDDDSRALGIQEFELLAKTTLENAAFSYQAQDIESAYRYVDNVWALISFFKGLTAAAIKETISNLNPIESFKGLVSIYQFSRWALTDGMEIAGLMKVGDIRGLLFSAIRSSPEIMNYIFDALDEHYQAFANASPLEKGEIIGMVGAAAASVFYNPIRLLKKASTEMKEGFIKTTAHATHTVRRTMVPAKVIARYGPHNPGPLKRNDVETFLHSKYVQKETIEELTLYRVYGGNAGQLGLFWSRNKPVSPFLSKLDLALKDKWGNTATRTVEIKVPKGTVFFEGLTAPQGARFPGGGNQVLLDFNVPEEWIVK